MIETSHVDVTARPIVRLPNELINQIAAGEVVERPASVLKELVENSLDAGSRRIEVRLINGGIDELTVMDDGRGMPEEDLKLCTERHTTSKIGQASDLESIGTYGFRGEALSSIASVSEVQVRSRTTDMPKANVLCVSFGETDGELRPMGAPVGTSITVRHLFDRIPARQKFLRSVGTEFSHCSKLFKDLALGTPYASFFLYHQGQLVQQYSAPTRSARFVECWKPKWTPVPITEEGDGIRLEAYLSPSHLIQERSEVALFINGRAVKNRVLFSAIRNAYQSALGPHHEPSGVVYLDIRKDWVDVNVHPQKWEVRLHRQEALYQWIQASLRKAIAQSKTVQTVYPEPSSPIEVKASEYKAPFPSFQRALPTRSTNPPADKSLPTQQQIVLDTHLSIKYLAQLKASYLLCEDSRGLVLVDQHALHEKIVFEKLVREFGAAPLKIQTLLVPKVISIPVELQGLFKEHGKLFEDFGFDLEDFGDGDIAVKSRPDILEESKVESVLLEVLRILKEGVGQPSKMQDQPALALALRPLFATLACHSVVRAGQSLSRTEAENLLSGLKEIHEGWTCPHGRPVLFRLSFQSIEKHFERT